MGSADSVGALPPTPPRRVDGHPLDTPAQCEHQTRRMMKTGIHIQSCNIGTCEAHNLRDAAYLTSLDESGKKFYDIFRDETHLNRSWVNKAYQGRTLDQVLTDLKNEVKNKTGRAMQAKANPIREGVCPIKENTQISDFDPVVDWFAEHGGAVIRIDIHRDEGHIDTVTGERKHNHHAHLVLDFINHRTGKSVKLSKADLSELQDIIAKALNMERGTSKEMTGAKHLTALEYREKKAGETVAALERREKIAEENVATLEHREKIAEENVTALEKKYEADKASIRATAADVGARVAALFNRGAIIEAQQERDNAILQAKEAQEKKQEAYDNMVQMQLALEKAENKAKNASKAKSQAEQDKRKYGLEMLKKGYDEGYHAGEASKNEKIEQLQRTIDEKNDIQSLTEKFLPNAKNIKENYDTMYSAGMSANDIAEVFQKGKKEQCQVYAAGHLTTADVQLHPSTSRRFLVWFNRMVWKDFCKAIEDDIKKAKEKVTEKVKEISKPLSTTTKRKGIKL